MHRPSPSLTIAAALMQGARRLRGADNPRLDAAVLLAAVLERPRSFLIAHPEQPLGAAQAERYAQWLERRAAGVPVAYLTGHREFWSLDLTVTPAVLAPRPETELLVECALAYLPPGAPCAALDLGTGSGAIALALAHERPAAHLLATDVSAEALAVARENARRLGLERVQFLQGCWYEALAGGGDGRRFDLIVANPPYIAADDPALKTPELSAEPHIALTPGPVGLEAIETIVHGAGAHLRPGGWLALEHGATQGAAVRSLLHRRGFEAIETLRDLAGHERVSRARVCDVSKRRTAGTVSLG